MRAVQFAIHDNAAVQMADVTGLVLPASDPSPRCLFVLADGGVADGIEMNRIDRDGLIGFRCVEPLHDCRAGRAGACAPATDKNWNRNQTRHQTRHARNIHPFHNGAERTRQA
jgi:hypothetical protein